MITACLVLVRLATGKYLEIIQSILCLTLSVYSGIEIFLPSNCVSETLHLRGNILEIPQCLAFLLHVSIFHAWNHSGSYNLVGVRL